MDLFHRDRSCKNFRLGGHLRLLEELQLKSRESRSHRVVGVLEHDVRNTCAFISQRVGARRIFPLNTNSLKVLFRKIKPAR